jgi:hypothetical protein
MREIEFLPDWYPRARRRQRMLALQVWCSALLIVGLGAWFTLARKNVAAAKTTLASVDAQLAQSRLELRQLDEQLELQEQLGLQKQIVSKLGLPVDMARLLQLLETVMPKEMSIVELTVDTEEQATAPADSSTSTQARQTVPERRLRVRVVAVAPSDVDLANFLAGLTATPFLDNVSMAYARDKSRLGHLMRESEVTFGLSLNEWTRN